MWKPCSKQDYIESFENGDNIVESTIHETIWRDRKTHNPVAKCNLGYIPKAGETSYHVWSNENEQSD